MPDPRTGAGASGTVYLATAEIVPLYEGLLEVALGPVTVVDVGGREIHVADAPSVIVNVGAVSSSEGFGAPQVPAGYRIGTTTASTQPSNVDITRDGRVGNGDAREAVLDWTLASYDAESCSSGTGDVDGDGCVTVADVQAVANAYSGPDQTDQAADQAAQLEGVTGSAAAAARDRAGRFCADGYVDGQRRHGRS